MKTKYKILIAIFSSVFVLDQLTKLAVESYFSIGTRLSIIPGFFDLVHFRNAGAAFGIFSNFGDGFRVPFFYVVAAAAVVLLSFFYRSLNENDRVLQVAVSLVLGGIAGNITDRIRFGTVVDFLSFHIGNKIADFNFLGRHFNFALEWPAFNVADSAITIAMFLLVWSAFFGRRTGHGARRATGCV